MAVGRQHWQLARDEFISLLEDLNSREIHFQRLFTKYPHILTDCLSLGIEPRQLIPCKPGRAEADFYFFPKAQDPCSTYGVIEIKRPQTRILREPRKDVICLAADAYTAFAQAQKYAFEICMKTNQVPSHQLFLGNKIHMFVIAGLSLEIAQKVQTDLHLAQFNRHIPPGLKLVTYDELSNLVALQVPPCIYIAVPWTPWDPGERFNRRSSLFGGIRQMYLTVCSECGQDTAMPFKPVKGKPIYCRDCYRKKKGFS